MVKKYRFCVSNFIEGRGTWDEINNSVLGMKPLAEKIEKLRTVIEPEIQKSIADLKKAVVLLEAKSNVDGDMLSKIKEDLKKLEEFANLLGIEVDKKAPSWGMI